MFCLSWVEKPSPSDFHRPFGSLSVFSSCFLAAAVVVLLVLLSGTDQGKRANYLALPPINDTAPRVPSQHKPWIPRMAPHPCAIHPSAPPSRVQRGINTYPFGCVGQTPTHNTIHVYIKLCLPINVGKQRHTQSAPKT